MKTHRNIVVITGGGRGIGRTIAEACAQEGFRVVITARSESELEETAKAIRDVGEEVEVIISDVTDERAVSDALDVVLKRWGQVDLLVNSAGSFSAVGPAWESDTEEWFRDIRTNLLGPHLWCHAVIPHMLEHNRGRIINMIGGGTYGPFEYGSGYGASKAAVMRYTETLAAELAGAGVTVFALDPGLVRTKMVERVLEYEQGKGWFGWMRTALDESKDAPATEAAAMVVQIASGRLDRLSGRAIFHHDDALLLENNLEDILERDLRTLRMRL
jgi:NAD(P)-dependent dehydrogenase (short-subunit alcohol dehydrogenase family)